MKTLLTSFVYFGMLTSMNAQNRVSIEEFDKITDPAERERIINQAPDDQKEALEKIDMHHMVQSQYGGNAALKRAIEKAVARTHGFAALTHLFEDRANLHQYYYGGYNRAYGKVNALHDNIQEMGRREDEEMRTLSSQVIATNDLVYHLAITPQAAALERRAEKD